MQHLISIMVENRPGVLARVAAMFSARGYNIDALSVAETLDPTISRITCMTSGGDHIVEQIVKHLRKLIDVLRVVQFPMGAERFVAREMALIKVRATDQDRGDLLRTAEIFKAKVVDMSKENITLEVTGDQGKIKAFLDLLIPLGILEIARTGPVALSRERRGLHTTAPNTREGSKKGARAISSGRASGHTQKGNCGESPRLKQRKIGALE